MSKKEEDKELQELKKEHDANEISDREFEEKKADPIHKTLKIIRNLLIALIVVMVLGFGFIVGYIIYSEVSYSNDLYYGEDEYEDYYEEDSTTDDEELSEDGEVAY